MATFIDLHRTFSRLADDRADPEEFVRRLGNLSWDDLITYPRVVVLAEAGSGKSVEFENRARRLTDDGKAAFFAPVQDVARDSVDRALTTADRRRLEAWRASDCPGWFFLDSVDEAKLDGQNLRSALRKVGDAIEGAEGRAHVLFSSRYTDWESRHDLDTFGATLPISPEAAPISAPVSWEEALREVLQREGAEEAKPAPAVEQPVVVVMSGLNRDQVAVYARASGLEPVDAFLESLEASNLWGLARRPLDLEWLVTRWRRDGTFGSYTEVLETSLRERLREQAPERERGVGLSPERARQGLERIGAALVLGQRDHLPIPDREVRVEFSAETILDDWSPEERRWLTTRAVFDPATFGRCRLHNDNRGDVRDFLAACWLRRLLPRCSRRTIRDLLFAESHGEKVARPAMRGVAAWLALWDSDIARELAARQPSVLLGAGDSGSLPLPVRKVVLAGVAGDLREFGHRRSWFERDQLTRFAQPDLADTIRVLWDEHCGSEAVRLFLLDLIWQGSLAECADLARGEVFGDAAGARLLVAAGRALCAAGTDRDRQDLAALVVEKAADLPPQIVWNTVNELFPGILHVDDFVSIVEQTGPTDEILVNGLRHAAGDYLSRITSLPDVERLLAGLLVVAKNSAFSSENGQDELFPAMLAAADRLLSAAPPDKCPEIAVDAVLAVGRARAFRGHRQDREADPRSRLEETWQRRRATFWRAVDDWNAKPPVGTGNLEAPHGVQFFGLTPPHRREDLGWVLVDMVSEPKGSRRALALATALLIWRSNDEDAGLLEQVRASIVGTDLRERFEASIAPRLPSEEERRLEAQLQEGREKEERRQRENISAWSNFVRGLRIDPDRLCRALEQPGDLPADLWNAWNLLCMASPHQSRRKLADLSPLLRLIGEDATAAAGDGFQAFWRTHCPTTLADRKPEEKNTVFGADCVGRSGIGVEAARDPIWTTRLSPDEASRTVAYACVETAEFPLWLDSVAARWPEETRAVLSRELLAEIDRRSPGEFPDLAHRIANGGDNVASAMAPYALSVAAARPELDKAVLLPLIQTAQRGDDGTVGSLSRLALDRASSDPDVARSAVYAATALRLDPLAAEAVLNTRLAAMRAIEQRSLGEHLLPLVFGSRLRHTDPVPELPFSTLVWLVGTSFQTVRPDEDIARPSGEVYSPGLRDDAQSARQAALDRLARIPGKATHDALRDLSSRPELARVATWLKDLAHQRALEDANLEPWAAGAISDFERNGLAAPRTTLELRDLALSLFNDVQDDLLHGEFNQGKVLQALPDECSVQNWVADRLKGIAGRRYTVDREAHVVDEREPDIRLRAVVCDASVAVEVKVTESWTFASLRGALINQLCGQYLRAETSRHGILLLVHQNQRPQGWERDGRMLSFEEVVAALQEEAGRIAGASPTAPQPAIGVLDVSALAPEKRSRRRGKTI